LEDHGVHKGLIVAYFLKPVNRGVEQREEQEVFDVITGCTASPSGLTKERHFINIYSD
jgi:hypothetical protein